MYFRQLCIFIFLINLSYAANTENVYKPPFSFSPLGGIWVRTLPHYYQEFHNEIVSVELNRSHTSDKQFVIDGSGSILTNFAYFKFRIYFKSNNDDSIKVVDLLKPFSELEYQSGGHILKDADNPEIFSLVEKKRVFLSRKNDTRHLFLSK